MREFQITGARPRYGPTPMQFSEFSSPGSAIGPAPTKAGGGSARLSPTPARGGIGRAGVRRHARNYHSVRGRAAAPGGGAPSEGSICTATSAGSSAWTFERLSSRVELHVGWPISTPTSHRRPAVARQVFVPTVMRWSRSGTTPYWQIASGAAALNPTRCSSANPHPGIGWLALLVDNLAEVEPLVTIAPTWTLS